MACSDYSESSTKMEDLLSNAPDIVIDKILESLPISMAAQTSVLSKQWRLTWLSLKSLIFELDFWHEHITTDGSPNWHKCSHIISSILLHHNGPVHEFCLFIPMNARGDLMNHSQWISFLSKNGVRNITISNRGATMDITSYIFSCSELVHLELNGFNLNPPPSDFIGFPHLKHLELVDIYFTKQNIFYSLIKSCKMLSTLQLKNLSGMVNIVIDAPRLQTLIIIGDVESLAFGNILSLKRILLYSRKMSEKPATIETIDALNLLASSCQLQAIQFGGHMCKFLAAGCIRRPPRDTFNHLEKLWLSNLNLSDFGVSHYLLAMIKCCPYIKTLFISVIPGENVGCQHILDYNYNYKLVNLLEFIINGITGSSAELKLVEYLLAISPALENLFVDFGILGIESQLKLSKALMRFPRASTKASLVCLEE